MGTRKRSMSDGKDISLLHKEWDEALCPICMDHPHNAVLIICTSHDKGCRSYICDTSYRHSYCLDRFKKLLADNNVNSSPPSSIPHDHQITINASDGSLSLSEFQGDEVSTEGDTLAYINLATRHEENNINSNGLETGESDSIPSTLKCPLCRGSVIGWKVVEEARQYLNSKIRSCSRETCSFSGSYRELRRHARQAHPTARPTDVDPTRQRAWRRLEHQREYGDIVSAIRSAMPNAVMFGDYAIENGSRTEANSNRHDSNNGSSWWTTFFLFQMIGSMDSDRRGGRGRSRVSSRNRRGLLWGENLLGLQDDDDEGFDEDAYDLNVRNDAGEDNVSSPPRRRRRLTRSRSDENEP